MLGLLENLGLAIEGAFVKARCEVANHIVDLKVQQKLRKYEKMQCESDEEEQEVEEERADSEDEETAENDGVSLGMMIKNFISASMPEPDYEADNHETEEAL